MEKGRRGPRRNEVPAMVFLAPKCSFLPISPQHGGELGSAVPQSKQNRRERNGSLEHCGSAWLCCRLPQAPRTAGKSESTAFVGKGKGSATVVLSGII